MTLLAGESVCEITDLQEWFGEIDVGAIRAGARYKERSLPPGSYRVVVRLSARTGRIRELPPVVEWSDTLSFVVLDSTGSPAEFADAEVRTLATKLGREGRGRSLTSRERRELMLNHVHSRHVYRLLENLHLREHELETRSLVAALERAQRSPVLAAAVLDYCLAGLRSGDKERRTFVAGMKGSSRSREVECVLESWLIRLRERRYYTSFGP
jgi:hypothetical protein